MTDNSEPDYGKSEGDSRRYRDLGNNYFKVKVKQLKLSGTMGIFKVGKDQDAIDMFNKAIMKGPLNSESKGRDFSLGLANRSAALMRLGHLEASLKDVDLALASGYPRDLRYKLYDRKIKLAANLGKNELAFNTRSEFIMALKVCLKVSLLSHISYLWQSNNFSMVVLISSS